MKTPYDHFQDRERQRYNEFFDGVMRAAGQRRAETPKASDIPEAGPANDTRELAEWFLRFAAACRSNLPPEHVSVS